jgi:hypothetical protein
LLRRELRGGVVPALRRQVVFGQQRRHAAALNGAAVLAKAARARQALDGKNPLDAVNGDLHARRQPPWAGG